MPVLDENRQIRHREFDWHVGTNVRYLRIVNDIDQKQLAKLVDMEPSQLCRVETGQRSAQVQGSSSDIKSARRQT